MKPFKPLGINNYGSIGHFSTSKLGSGDKHINEGMERILTEKVRDKHDQIYVFEKYDGTNVGVAKLNGKIITLQRSGYLCETSPHIMHHAFYVWVMCRYDLFDKILKEGERICGEWMVKVNTIKYNIQGDPVKWFDVFNSKNERYSVEHLFDICDRTNLIHPRIIHAGYAYVLEDAKRTLIKYPTRDCIPMGCNPEGLVYRVERKGVFDFAAKWVRSDYETGKYINDNIWNKII